MNKRFFVAGALPFHGGGNVVLGGAVPAFGQGFGLLAYARFVGELWRTGLGEGDQHNSREYETCCDLVLC